MTLGYDIGLSAIRAHQVRIATHGNNIANAATPGYARQVVDLVELPQYKYRHLLLGSGVEASEVRSLRDSAAEAGLGRNASLIGGIEVQLDAAKALESELTPSDSSIHAILSDVFNNLERVANAPEDSTARAEFIRSAESLVEKAGLIASNLNGVQLEAAREHNTGVETVNTLIHEIAGLNSQILASQGAGKEPHALLSQRDNAVAKLSEWMEVSVSSSDSGPDIVVLGGGAAVFTVDPITLQSDVSEDGVLSIRNKEGLVVAASGGRLDGLETVHNSTITSAQQDLETLVGEVVRQLDQLHATGLASPGGFKALTGTRGPQHADVPLAIAGLPFDAAAGEVYVSVTDRSTGVRKTTAISIDPQVESLQDFADKLSAIDGLNAVVTGGSNQLVIQGADGFTFDFAGRPDNIADRTSFAGTSEVRFSGRYLPQPPIDRAYDPAADGSSPTGNERFSISLPSPGQIGVTAGLTAEVRDSSGTLVQVIELGPEYTVGTPISLNNGLFVSFGEGTAVAGDEVGVSALQNPDTSGLLSALGVNSLFTGDSLTTFHVRADIQKDPFLFSAAVTGEPGDGGIAALMASVRDHRFESLGNRSFVETLADLTAAAGLDVQQLEGDLSRLENYRSQLQSSRDSLSGVDTNEELLQLLAAERAFQAAARYVATYDETVVELLGLVN